MSVPTQMTSSIEGQNIALAITACDSFEGQVLALMLSDYIQKHYQKKSNNKDEPQPVAPQLLCLARDRAKCGALNIRDNCKVVEISYDDPTTIAIALRGVQTVILDPEIEPQRVDWAIKVIDTMVQEKVVRCILISGIGTDDSNKDQLDRFRRVEDKVKDTIQRWTILREGFPFQALFYWIPMILDLGVLGMPIGPEIEFAPLDLSDLGHALISVTFSSMGDGDKGGDQDHHAKVKGKGKVKNNQSDDDSGRTPPYMTPMDDTSRFDGQVYTLTGPETTTGPKLVDELNRALAPTPEESGSSGNKDTVQQIEPHKDIVFKQITREEFRTYLLKLRNKVTAIEPTPHSGLLTTPGIREFIWLFQRASEAMLGNSRLIMGKSVYAPLKENDDKIGHGDAAGSLRGCDDPCGNPKDPEEKQPRLGAPNDTEVDLMTELMEYIGENRATFQSGDLEKITGERGANAKDFFEKHARNFAPERKSTVASTIKTLGIPLIDCDLLARLVVEPTHSAYKKLVKHFGTVILQNQEMGQPLDRYKFGTIIFGDAAQRKVANSIIHPAIRDEILKRLFKLWIKGTSLVVIDVPLLLEGELWRIVSKVIVVYCPPEVQLERIQSRDGLSAEDALARINAQRPLIEKVDYADHVIYNTSDLESLKQSTLKVMDALKPNPVWTVLAYIPPFAAFLAFWEITKRHLKGDPRKTKPTPKNPSAPAHAS
ncbi:hypothetical protein BGZ51_006429 [Haplosporangium sp. Z 767]|nr:hypothetical protein BGZ51_006429 [Haplosporangium sp. Z 767]KAF9192207.1 hypothetical protein BGZ50_008725 [Haplosporangium sp. Z 11]